MAKRYANDRKAWTPAEDALLVELAEAGVPVGLLARVLGRSPHAVRTIQRLPIVYLLCVPRAMAMPSLMALFCTAGAVRPSTRAISRTGFPSPASSLIRSSSAAVHGCWMFGRLGFFIGTLATPEGLGTVPRQHPGTLELST